MSEIEILDAESNVTPKDYLNHLLEFSKQSTQKNSIIFDFEVDANYCHCKITKYEIDGTRKEERQETFNNIEEVIEEILEPFLKKFANDNKIVINNISSYKEDTTSLKIISESNDMCNIYGIDEIIATKLSELVNKLEQSADISLEQQKIDNRGVGNVFAFVISILVLGVVMLGLLIPNFIK